MRKLPPAAPVTNENTVVVPVMLVFFSGFCALLYQTAWMKAFCLFFGNSTMASAFVLAVFMGGLGFGAMILGQRVEKGTDPLRFYALLEVSIGFWAIWTPFMCQAVRAIYLATGGVETLGAPLSIIARVLLSGLVVGVPAFLMGGTLPAISLGVVSETDFSRRMLGYLYGSNTLGGFAGVFLTTFFFLERWGIDNTIRYGGLVNLLVGVLALFWARNTGVVLPGKKTQMESSLAEKEGCEGDKADSRFSTFLSPTDSTRARNRPDGESFSGLSFGAFASGFGFLTMELVWYRMLAPLVGGSVYSLGLILSIILLGIGVGGAIGSARRSGFFLAFLFGLQGLTIGLPYILGDQVALLAVGLKSLENLGFWGRVFDWSLLLGLVVFPASVVAGVTFPCLISAMGEGNKNIAAHTGRLYFFNTIGAILGSFLTGFLLIPALSAPGVWRLITILFFLSGAVGMLFSIRRRPLVATGFLLMFSLGIQVVFSVDGPTAAWRHAPIGAGRQNFDGITPNGIKDWLHSQRRQVIWEADGVESCIGVMAANGYSLIINGKSDGNVIGDAETTVMLGLIPAVLQGKPEQALVIGLGTGVTAGWLAAVDSIKQVDVLELESKVTHIASICSSANFQIMQNPKVAIHIGDAREWVLTTKRSYDVIVSEPSNPYRAGVASLFSKEFYQAVFRILRPDGVYAQWVQGYEIGFPTFLSIYATMRAVFPAVEIWTSGGHDLLLVASLNQRPWDAAALRQRLAREPYKTALERISRVSGLEGLLSLYLANPDFNSVVQSLPMPLAEINTDDRLVVEFGFARSVGLRMAVKETDLLRIARERGMGQPIFEKPVEGQPLTAVKGKLVDEFRIYHLNVLLNSGNLADNIELAAKNNAWKAYSEARFDSVPLAWNLQPQPPETPMAVLMMAESYAQQGDSRALPLIEQIKAYGWPEADGLGGIYLFRQGYIAEAQTEWKKFFLALKQEPWVYKHLADRIIRLWANTANTRPEMRDALVEVMGEPFAVSQFQEDRRLALVETLADSEDSRMIKILEDFEPNIPWNQRFLSVRLAHYRRANHRLKQRAAEDLDDFVRHEPFGAPNLFKTDPR